MLERAEGLLCLTGCARHGALEHPDERVALERCRQLDEAFGRTALRRAAAAASGAATAPASARLLERSRAGSGCRSVRDQRRARARAGGAGALQDALVAIRVHRPLDACEAERRGNREHVLKRPARDGARCSPTCPRRSRATAEIADRIDFDLTRDLGYRLPAADDTEPDAELAPV